MRPKVGRCPCTPRVNQVLFLVRTAGSLWKPRYRWLCSGCQHALENQAKEAAA